MATKRQFKIRLDEDGQAHTLCPTPRCKAVDSIVEVDRAVRWNRLDLSAYPLRVAATLGDDGYWDFDAWLCVSCQVEVMEPDGFEIGSWS